MSTLEQFARRVLGPDATDQTVSELTACLHYGNGAMRLTGSHGLVVMGNPGSIMAPGAENFRPTILCVRAGIMPRQVTVCTTEQVGKHWRDIGSKFGLGRQRPNAGKAYKNWAPAATRSLARVVIGGPYGKILAATPDRTDQDNTYEWYDLLPVPVGGVIYRISKDCHVTAFQRLTAPGEDDLWAKVNCGNGQREFGDAARVYADDPVQPYTPDTAGPRPLLFGIEAAREVYATAQAARDTPRS